MLDHSRLLSVILAQLTTAISASLCFFLFHTQSLNLGLEEEHSFTTMSYCVDLVKAEGTDMGESSTQCGQTAKLYLNAQQVLWGLHVPEDHR